MKGQAGVDSRLQAYLWTPAQVATEVKGEMINYKKNRS